GRLAQDLTRCDARAAVLGMFSTPGCIAHADERFTERWARAGRRGACGVEGDGEAVASSIDGLRSDIALRLDLTGQPSRCAAVKLRESGAALRCALRCEANALRLGGDTTPACLAHCRSGFADRCEHAEDLGDCKHRGDCDTLETRITETADAIAVRLCPECAAQCGDGIVTGEERCDPPGSEGACDPGSLCSF